MKANVREILKRARTIAVVGLSSKKTRPSYNVAEYLKRMGYQIIPVNPNEKEVLGQKAYPDLESIPPEIQIDIVNIFRRPDQVLPIVRQAIKRGVPVIWMQEGVVNEAAAAEARKAGLTVIMDRCILKEHRKHCLEEELPSHACFWPGILNNGRAAMWPASPRRTETKLEG